METNWTGSLFATDRCDHCPFAYALCTRRCGERSSARSYCPKFGGGNSQILLLLIVLFILLRIPTVGQVTGQRPTRPDLGRVAQSWVMLRDKMTSRQPRLLLRRMAHKYVLPGSIRRAVITFLCAADRPTGNLVHSEP